MTRYLLPLALFLVGCEMPPTTSQQMDCSQVCYDHMDGRQCTEVCR